MSEEKVATKQSVKGNSLPNKLWIEISSKQIPQEISTEEYLKKCAHQKVPKEKSLRRNILKRKLSPPPKKIKQFLTKNYLQKIYQGNSEKTFPAKKNLIRNLCQTISQETFPHQTKLKKHLYEKNIWRKNLSPPKKKHLHQKIWENHTTRNMAKIRTDEIWWHNLSPLDFISFDVCNFSSKKQFGFFWWKFLLNFFFVGISIGWIFWVEMPLQLLFGRAFWFGWLRSLLGYLGKLLVSYVFW